MARLQPRIRALTDQQRTALALLLQGHKPTAVAKIVGVNVMELYRWRNDHPEFAPALAHSSNLLIQQTMGEVVESALKAVQTLREIASNDESRDCDRIAAAKGILASFDSLVAWQTKRAEKGLPDDDDDAIDLDELEAELAARKRLEVGDD